MAGRASAIEMHTRVDWVLQQMAAGRPRMDLAREVRDRYGLSESQSYRLLQAADAARAAVFGQINRAAMLTGAVDSLQRAAEIALKNGQPMAVIAAVNALDRLLHFGAGWGPNGQRDYGNSWDR
jgi:hypothetical protein